MLAIKKRMQNVPCNRLLMQIFQSNICSSGVGKRVRKTEKRARLNEKELLEIITITTHYEISICHEMHIDL